MRRYFLSVIIGLILIVFLVSCGGGGGGGGGSASSGNGTSNVSITVGGSGQTAKVMANQNTLIAMAKQWFNKLLATDTAIAGIPTNVYKIAFSITGSDMAAITEEVLVEGRTEITKTFSVPNGTSRLFVISEFDSSGYLVYRGETTANLNGGSVELPVSVKTRDNSLADWFERFRQVLNRKPNLTAADLDPFFSANYGIHNGYDRTQEINDYLNPNEGPPTDLKKITSLSGLIAEPIGNGKYEVKGTAYFDDGSKANLEPAANFIVAYENDTFKLKGNGYYSDVEIRAESHVWTNYIASWYCSSPWSHVGCSDPGYKSGLYIDIKDRGGWAPNAKYAVITGNGLGSGISMTRVSGKNHMALDVSYRNSYLPTDNYNFYVMTDGNIASITDNSIYTVVIKDANYNVLETRYVRLPKRPLKTATELSSTYFPWLTKINGYTPASSYNYISAAKIGGTLTFEFDKPTAFSSTSPLWWMWADLNYWDGSNNSADKDVDLLINGSSGSITTSAPGWTPTIGHLEIAAEDSDGRVFVNHWLFQ